MNKEQFLNQEIINKDNEKGIVTSFDDEHIDIKYSNQEKTYSVLISFKNKYLSFADNSLNKLVEEYLSNKEENRLKFEKEAEINHRISVNRIKKINELYKKISKKNDMMMTLFGRDFKYPPFKEFKNKYRHYITKTRSKYSGFIAETYGR